MGIATYVKLGPDLTTSLNGNKQRSTNSDVDINQLVLVLDRAPWQES